MNKRQAQGFLAAAFMLLNLPAFGEDVDLFAPRPPDEATGRPQVLIIVDNTANWNDAFENEKSALKKTFDGLPESKFEVGLMFFGDPDVGYVRAAIRPMDAVNRPLYSAMINNLHRVNDRGNARTLARTFSEAHRYLKGLESTDDATIKSVHNVKRDYTKNTAGNAQDDAVHARPGNALDDKNAMVYRSPIDPENCFGTYIIYIGNVTSGGNVVQDNTSRNTDAGNELALAGGDKTPIPLPVASVHDDNYADEWTRFLKKDMGVITYTVDVDPGNKPGGIGNTALLKSMAEVSGGKYFAVKSAVGGGAEISDALNRIFSEIQAVNSVFASVSLPLSVNTQGTYLNQIYVGMFRPDPQADPRWLGNLKQYRMGRTEAGDQLVTQDADGRRAVNPKTGFITECARSYWTADDNYWAFLDADADPDNNMPEMCLDTNRFSNSPDGNLVEKGGQAQGLRSDPRADLWTCTACGPGALLPFTTGNVTAASLGVAAGEHANTVNWGRGLDVDDEDADGVTIAETRPSAHGDVVHSRPVAVNFGDADEDSKVVVFYGANDGILRAINGNREPTVEKPLADVAINGVAPGDELWAFMAPEFFPHVQRLRKNDPAWRYLLTPFPLESEPKPYGVDGPITAYLGDEGAWLYATLRRGGRAAYAFDVADIASDTPSPPTLKWKIGCPNAADDVGCTAGFDGLGQTWSSAKVITSAGYPADPGDPRAPMVIMGGGYDTCEDTDDGIKNHSCTAASNGRHVYVVDADTGVRLKTFNTERSVVADIFVVKYRCPDSDAAPADPDEPDDPATCPNVDGKAKWGYVADLGGNLYRISGATANTPIGTTAPADWTMTKIASLGCDDTDLNPDPAVNPCLANRKFIFAPDVVAKSNVVPEEKIYYLLIGSGDREKPLKEFVATYAVNNYFFMVQDKPRDPAWLNGELDECGASVICKDSLLEIGVDDLPDPEELAARKGWALELRDHEQIVTSAITLFGTTTFSSHTPFVPVAGSCESNLGTARVYNIRYLDASSRNGTADRSQKVAGGGLPPSPVAGRVLLDGEAKPVPFIIGASPDSPLDAKLPTGAGTGRQPKSLTYWHIEK